MGSKTPLMKILKFGGTSVGSPESIKKVIEIVRAAHSQEPCVVVVSAFTKVTDQLIVLALAAVQRSDYSVLLSELEARHFEAVRSLVTVQEQPALVARMKELCNELADVLKGVSLVGELTLQTKDLIMSFGERLSATCISAAFSSTGILADFLDTRPIVKTDSHFGSAGIVYDETYENIKAYFNHERPLMIVTGFIGSTSDGHTTTLGRGGSDLTASLFGAALDVSVIEIWTDVDGVLTADPSVVEGARHVTHMTYEEAMELSYFGAKVIYYPTIYPAFKKNIPLVIKNTFKPDAPGTVISQSENVSPLPVTGITSMGSVALVRIQGVGLVGVAGTARRVFQVLGGANINVILISQASSEYSICVAIDSATKEKAREVLNNEFAFEIQKNVVEPVVVENTNAVISVIGVHMRKSAGTAGRIFSAIGREGINIAAIAQGSSELNISFVVDENNRNNALRAVHNEFFQSVSSDSQQQATSSLDEPAKQEKQINIFLVGTGLIGSTLLSQISNQAGTLFEKNGITLRLCGLANARTMVFDAKGISWSAWERELSERGVPADLSLFSESMKKMDVGTPIFVDCTASQDVANLYEQIIDSGIALVAANKKANSGDLASYNRLHKMAQEKNIPFLYETNVGAALPVISTLQGLVRTGDHVKKIEAILSGTLSYIFNTFGAGDRAFSDIVREAKEKGYTEPDPRDDLSGLDVARKVVILAREMGLSLDVKDIIREPLLGDDCFSAHSVDDFFVVLKNSDAQLDERRMNARARGNVLRFIATIDEGSARMQLEEVGSTHPFYTLSGSDNIISFTTSRYCETPLVVKGPGAGAQVTAGGVFADILKAAGFR